jgi:hypothetical protein
MLVWPSAARRLPVIRHGCLRSNSLGKVFFSLSIATRFKNGERDLRWKLESRTSAASSIRERIYISAGLGTTVPEVGILIYTASAGNQGTLGGLVEVSRRFVQVLENALERQRLCSGDPVCADHDPATAADDRTLHGAACHGCLVIAETSCEARNLFLDRALLVDTVGPSGVCLF